MMYRNNYDIQLYIYVTGELLELFLRFHILALEYILIKMNWFIHKVATTTLSLTPSRTLWATFIDYYNRQTFLLSVHGRSNTFYIFLKRHK